MLPISDTSRPLTCIDMHRLSESMLPGQKRDFLYFISCIDVTKRSKVKRVMVEGHKRSRSKVRVKGQGHY